MFALSQILCFTETYSVVMLNSTFGNERWAFPRYFEYDIARGPGNSRVEWIRVFTPGMWQPVAEPTLGPAPDHASTYQWRRVYHFDVCCPRDSTGGTTADAHALPVLLHVAISILCTLDCRPRRRLRFRMVLGVNLLPRRATILILTGTSDSDAWADCCLKLIDLFCVSSWGNGRSLCPKSCS